MRKYKPTKEEQKALNRIKAMQKVWEKMHPFEMAMSKKAVETAVPKSTRKLLAKIANSKETIKAVAKFFKQADSLKK